MLIFFEKSLKNVWWLEKFAVPLHLQLREDNQSPTEQTTYTMLLDLKTTSRLERTEAVAAFINNAKKYGTATKEETNALAIAAKNGGKKERDELVNRNLFFIFSVCKKYANGEDVLDLIGLAAIGMLNALNTYEPKSGTSFLTYAVYSMQTEIHSYLFNDNLSIKRKNWHLIGNKANKASQAFYAEEGRYPTEFELTGLLKEQYGIEVSEDDLVSYSTEHFEDACGEDGTNEDCGEFALATSSENGFISIEETEDRNRTISALCSVLTPRERFVIERTFGIGCEYEYNCEDIADELGLTKMRVSQIVNEALAKMKKHLQKSRMIG